MKKSLLIIVQFFLFYVIFFIGSLLDPFRMRWFVSHPALTSTRYFVPDGLLITCALFLIILTLEAVTRRLRSAGALTSIAFAAAILLGCLSKFGWLTHDLF